MKYRPEGWDMKKIRLNTHKEGKYADNDLVEAGADAMLEALKTHAITKLVSGGVVLDVEIINKQMKGTIVFIPEE